MDNAPTPKKKIKANNNCGRVETVSLSKEAQSNVWNLLNEDRKNPEKCDLILICGTHRIGAHKFVLSANVPFFKMAIESNMKETELNEVHLKSIECETMECVLNYVYNQNISITEDNVQDLTSAASFLGLPELLNDCFKFIVSIIRPDNVLTIRNFIVTLDANQPQIDLVDHFIQHNFLLVSRQDEILDLSEEGILNIISSDKLKVKNEMDVYETVMRWIQHDDSRVELLPKLLSKVRLTLLSHTDRQALTKNNLVRSSVECRDLIDQANYYHIIKASPSSLTITRRRPEYRTVVFVDRETENDNGVISFDTVLGSLQTVFYDTVSCTPLNTVNDEIYLLIDNKRLAASTLSGQYLDVDHTLTYNMSGENFRVHLMENSRVITSWSNYGLHLQSISIHDENSSMKTTIAHRVKGAAEVFLDKLYFLGGRYTSGNSYLMGNATNDVHVHDWDVPHLRQTTPMQVKRENASAIAFKGKIYVFGGYCNNTYQRSGEVYNPSTMSWAFVAHPRTKHTKRIILTSSKTNIYAMSVVKTMDNYFYICEQYNDLGNTWSVLVTKKL